jgi:hypothetical protein
MKRVIIRFLAIAINLVFGLILLCFLPAVVRQLLGSLSEFVSRGLWPPIAIGAVLGVGVERVLARYVPWFRTLEHEVTHALAGLPFGYIPVEIHVTSDRGGYCRQVCLVHWLTPITRHIVTLAPYFLPTLTVIMAACRPLAADSWQPWYDLVLGVTFGYHTVSTIEELRRSWFWLAYRGDQRPESMRNSDFHQSGPVFSWIFVLVMTLAVHGTILAMMVRGYSGVATDLRGIFVETFGLIGSFLSV